MLLVSVHKERVLPLPLKNINLLFWNQLIIFNTCGTCNVCKICIFGLFSYKKSCSLKRRAKVKTS